MPSFFHIFTIDVQCRFSGSDLVSGVQPDRGVWAVPWSGPPPSHPLAPRTLRYYYIRCINTISGVIIAAPQEARMRKVAHSQLLIRKRQSVSMVDSRLR